MLYELTTLSCPLLSIAEAADTAHTWMNDGRSGGELLGCWRTEVGTLGRLLILRGFKTLGALAAERSRTLLNTNPFNSAGIATGVEMVDVVDEASPHPLGPIKRARFRRPHAVLCRRSPRRQPEGSFWRGPASREGEVRIPHRRGVCC